jgi:hypothetical protein
VSFYVEVVSVQSDTICTTMTGLRIARTGGLSGNEPRGVMLHGEL